jgi:hypothetical protein
MSPTPAARLCVRVDQKSSERLLAETLLRRAVAERLIAELPDDTTLKGKAGDYIADALAARVVAAELAAVTPTHLVEALQRYGVPRQAAHEHASLLQAERTVADERELPSPAALATAIMGHTNGSPYVQVDARAADAASPAAPEPVPDGPPDFCTPAGEGRPPTHAEIDAARAQHAAAVAEFFAIREGQSPAAAALAGHRAHDAYVEGAS